MPLMKADDVNLLAESDMVSWELGSAYDKIVEREEKARREYNSQVSLSKLTIAAPDTGNKLNEG